MCVECSEFCRGAIIDLFDRRQAYLRRESLFRGAIKYVDGTPESRATIKFLVFEIRLELNDINTFPQICRLISKFISSLSFHAERKTKPVLESFFSL